MPSAKTLIRKTFRKTLRALHIALRIRWVQVVLALLSGVGVAYMIWGVNALIVLGVGVFAHLVTVHLADPDHGRRGRHWSDTGNGLDRFDDNRSAIDSADVLSPFYWAADSSDDD